MLETRDLRLFTCLADELHFGRAAERLGIAQSTLSVQLKRMEDVIGARLFERHKRAAVRLTDVGRTLIDDAHDALDRLARVETVGRMASRGEAGRLDLGYIFSAAMNGMLGAALAILRAEAPLLEPRPKLLDTPSQVRAVAERRLDLGLCRPRPSYPAQVCARIVHREPLGLLVRADHRLAAASRAVPDDLRAEVFLLPQFNERFGLLEKLDRLGTAGGFVAPTPVRTGDFVTAAAMAVAGYGIVLGPASLIGLGMAALRFVPLDRFDDPIETALIWHEDANPMVRALAESPILAPG